MDVLAGIVAAFSAWGMTKSLNAHSGATASSENIKTTGRERHRREAMSGLSLARPGGTTGRWFACRRASTIAGCISPTARCCCWRWRSVRRGGCWRCFATASTALALRERLGGASRLTLRGARDHLDPRGIGGRSAGGFAHGRRAEGAASGMAGGGLDDDRYRARPWRGSGLATSNVFYFPLGFVVGQ